MYKNIDDTFIITIYDIIMFSLVFIGKQGHLVTQVLVNHCYLGNSVALDIPVDGKEESEPAMEPNTDGKSEAVSENI